MFVKFQDVQKRVPISFLSFAIILIIVLSVFSLLLGMGRYQRKNLIEGVYRTGNYVSIKSSTSGTIAKIFVRQGQVVKKGQRLVEVTSSDGNSVDNATSTLIEQQIMSLEKLLYDLAAARSKLDSLSFDSELSDADSKKHGLLGEAALLRAIRSAQTYQKNLSKQIESTRNLVAQGAVRGSELEQRNLALLESSTKTDQLIQTMQGLQQSRSEKLTNAMDREVNRRLQMANLDTQILDQRGKLSDLLARRSSMILSSVDGRVDSVLLREGDNYSKDQSIVSIEEKGKKDAELIFDVDDAVVGFLDPSQEIIVRFNAFPYEIYGVLKAKITYIPSSGVPKKNDLKGRIVYPVSAQIFESVDDRIKISSLQNGMSLSAYVSQPPLSLFEWLMLPVKKAFLRNPS